MTTNITLSSSAILVDVTISTWTARKLDKAVTDEVNVSKNADGKASRVNKNLLAGVPQLEEINSYAAAVRNWVYSQTLPWSDYGTRIIPTGAYFAFHAELTRRQAEFEQMVNDFVRLYPTLISAQAFKLGQMFNRDEYPKPEFVAERFSIQIAYSPVPDAGDFRVDVGAEGLRDLQERYEKVANSRLEMAMGDVRSRLLKALEHLSDRMEDDGDKRKRFSSSILESFADTLASVRQLNLTRDDVLDSMAKEAEHVVKGLDVDDLREDPECRKDVKKAMDDILSRLSI